MSSGNRGLPLAAIFALGWAPAALAQTSYSGRAYAAFAESSTAGIAPTYVSDTGDLPPSGGFQSNSLATVAVPGVLEASILNASTSGAAGVARSSASLVDVNVLNGLVQASALRAESEATCLAVRGATEAADLRFAGTAVVVDPFAPNQTFGPVDVPGVGTATLVINEQIANATPGAREITVRALHLTVTGLVAAEVILSHAYSDVAGCPGCPSAPECHDFVTGGGWIDVGGDRANFGFNAGFKAGGPPEAHLNYIDHRTGMHVKATSITTYVQGSGGATSRRFEGSAEIDGLPGYSYSAEVDDRGEPGRKTDTFRIRLSTGYEAGGVLQGGNIQLHRPCP